MNPQVLIVGAGPVGLTLAAECQRHGVSFRIIDKAPGHSVHSKALAIWSGTLEHLAATGLAEDFLPIFTELEPFKKRAAFALSGLGISYSPGPLIESDSRALSHHRALALGSLARHAQVQKAGSPTFALARTVTPRSQFAALLWAFSVGEHRRRDLRHDQRIPWRFQSVFRHLASGSATFHFGKRDLAARS